MDAKTIDLTDPSLYFNRELSLLEFNRRVLAQATDRSHPLLERLRYLCITSSNLDEFFEIRVAGLKQQVAFGATSTGPDKLLPGEQLKRISAVAHEIVSEQYKVLNTELIPELEKEGIRFVPQKRWNARLSAWARRYFTRELMPILSPVGLDPSHPFPRILNKSLNFLVALDGSDAFGRTSPVAIVQAPRALPRIISVAESAASVPHEFIYLSTIIETYVAELFPGMQVAGCYPFRVTRDSDLLVDDEEVEDLLRALEGELHQRRYGDAVRLEAAAGCPEEMISFLTHQFKLDADDIYQCDGPVNLKRLMEVPDMIDRPDLKFEQFQPAWPRRMPTGSSMFEVIRKGDLLLHHPFESFGPVIEFLRQAAADPDVLVIKQTLYRTGPDSPIANRLVDAARAGKEVTVVVELKARFDEAANIELANRLQEAGAHVVYGVVGHKTHAKMILVVRREGRSLRRYVHLGTGNYHPSTARLYTDYGLFTSDNSIGMDVQKLFHQLTAPSRTGKLKKLVQSPFTLHTSVLAKIAREAEVAHAGRPARIMAKMNSLIEPQVIQALYEASQAGVRIDLVVRGVCSLRPGVKGVSDNISVRSVIGRFLEHTRVFYFLNDGEPDVFMSSADWMGRNFFSRIEVAFPIEDRRQRERVIKECLNNYLSDNVRAWTLSADGTYARVKPGNAKPRNAQQRLIDLLAD